MASNHAEKGIVLGEHGPFVKNNVRRAGPEKHPAVNRWRAGDNGKAADLKRYQNNQHNFLCGNSRRAG